MPKTVGTKNRERLSFGLEEEPDSFSGNAAVYRICEGVFDGNRKRRHRRMKNKEKIPDSEWKTAANGLFGIVQQFSFFL